MATTRVARWTVAAIAVALVAIAVVRTTQTGFSTVDADDPHYLFQGRTVLELRMPEQVDGSFPNLRAPLYGILIAAGDTVVGGSEFLGAHLVAFVLALATLAAAVAVGARMGGAPAAAGVALALLVTPLVWLMLPSLRVDLVHAGAILAVVLLAWRPTTRRFLLAGVAFGLTLLVKESVLLLALLPCAWIGIVPRRDVVRLTGAYLGAALLTAGWWWVLVWVQVREIFPAANVVTTLDRGMGRPFSLNTAVWLLVGAFAAGWVLFVARWRHRGDARLVMIAGIATLVPAAIAWQQELAMRQYTQVVIVTCIAAGTAFGELAASVWRERTSRGALAAFTAALAIAVAVAVAAASQLRTPAEQHTAGVADELSSWMGPRVGEQTGVVMTHRDHGELAVRLQGQGDVAVHRIDFESADGTALGEFVWLETDRGRLIGVSRDRLAAQLRDPETEYLVLTGPHLFALPGVEQALRTGAAEPDGVMPAGGIMRSGYHAHVFEVDPSSVDPQLADLPLAMTARAAGVWLDQRSTEVGRDRAVADLLAADPSIVGRADDRRALRSEVGREAATALDLPGARFPSRR